MTAINNYGMNGYDFKNGVSIDKHQIESWINRSTTYLKENKDESYHYVASGNTIVIGFKQIEEGEEKIDFIVCKNYEHYEQRTNKKKIEPEQKIELEQKQIKHKKINLRR